MSPNRYLASLSLILCLASVPTVIHRYTGTTRDDGRIPAGIPLQLEGVMGRATGRLPSQVEAAYGTTDFIERRYGAATLFVARSYDAKQLYHHPELAIAHGDRYERARVVRLDGRPEVPIFVLSGDSNRYSAYALLSSDKFVEDPIKFQLRQAFKLLVRPREPMTLFFVRGSLEVTSVHSLLFAAIDAYRVQNRSGTTVP